MPSSGLPQSHWFEKMRFAVHKLPLLYSRPGSARNVLFILVLLGQVHLLCLEGLHRHHASAVSSDSASQTGWDLARFAPSPQPDLGCPACQLIKSSAGRPAPTSPLPELLPDTRYHPTECSPPSAAISGDAFS